VTVGGREDLRAAGLVAREANWLVDADRIAADGWRRVSVQYRYNSAALPARVRRLEDTDEPTPSGRPGRFEVAFDAPVEAVAPGQAAVVYDESDADLVLGGGWIERAIRD
jgi:tRNA-specific 2-thiouridylase